jgi:hypothetical protein
LPPTKPSPLHRELTANMVEFFAKKIETDPDSGKALNFRIYSLQHPHMRALHLVC